MFPTPPSLAPEPLKVMSYNIRYGTANDGEDRWEVRRPRTIALLKRESPDLIGLQEALDFQIDQIRTEMPYLASVGVGRDDGKAAGEHSAILYDTRRLQVLRSDTVWLSDTPTVPGSKHWGNGITRICTWAYFRDRATGAYFWHFNLHLDHISQPSREKSVQLLAQRVKDRGTNDPVLISGDFNVGEDNPVVAMVKEAGFEDSYRVKQPNVPNVGTFSAFKERGSEKIDYIFVGTGIDVLRSEIVLTKIDGHWPSDHCPVTATIQIKPI